MSSPDKIQQKIYYGYSRAAGKIGAQFNIYRSNSTINPIDPSNFVGSVKASTTQDWKYMTSHNYGDPVFYLLADAQRKNLPNAVQLFDYLVPTVDPVSGFILDDRIYFVGSMDFFLPMNAIQCNRTLSLVRPSQTSGPGYVGYVGHQPSTDVVVASNLPASVLKIRGGKTAPSMLPTDTKQPAWIILVPNLGGVVYRVGDIFIDEFKQQYQINQNELSDLGWRIDAIQVVNTR